VRRSRDCGTASKARTCPRTPKPKRDAAQLSQLNYSQIGQIYEALKGNFY